MTLPWEEGEYVFCDLQDIGRRIRKHDADRAVRFWRAVYATFDFICDNPEIGRRRHDLGRPEIRSWQVRGFNRFVIFYRIDSSRVLIYRVLDGTRDLNRDLAKD
jgi:toxin ParE1/3/4